jgi:glycosyltransferase involved in cell wall biosynthesis
MMDYTVKNLEPKKDCSNISKKYEKDKEEIAFLVDITVLIITYNHEKYISQCLDGVLNQITKFSFEIVIHDDASTDNTQMLLKQYKKLYPSKIHLILQRKNLYQNGESIMSQYLPYLKGKYIANCEGDDYWSDNSKLDKQIRFLELHPEYVACYHNVKTVDENGETYNRDSQVYPFKNEHRVTKRSLRNLRLPSQTASLVYRNIWFGMSELMMDDYIKCRGNGDHKIASLLSFYGKIYFLDDIMAIHRKIVLYGDSWTARMNGKNLWLNTYNMILDINQFTLKYFGTRLISKKKRLGTISGATLQYVHSQTDIDKEIMMGIYKINQDSFLEVIACSYIRMIYQNTRKFYSALKGCSRF